jgi:hypothetical protein
MMLPERQEQAPTVSVSSVADIGRLTSSIAAKPGIAIENGAQDFADHPVKSVVGAVVMSEGPGAVLGTVGEIAGVVGIGKTTTQALGGADVVVPGATSPKYILDTNAVITDGKRLVNGGVDVVKPDVFKNDIASAIKNSGGRLQVPKVADKIPDISTKDVDVNTAINVRGGLTPTKSTITPATSGNVLDGRIGGKAVESGIPLVTNDKKLIKAVNSAGGTAIKPSDVPTSQTPGQ